LVTPDPEEGGSTFLRNVNAFLLDYTALKIVLFIVTEMRTSNTNYVPSATEVIWRLLMLMMNEEQSGRKSIRTSTCIELEYR
jgi:hypothetical protein